jgi:hypothetical protein
MTDWPTAPTRHYQPWTKADVTYLHEHQEDSDEAVATALGRTPAAIHTKRSSLANDTERHVWLRANATRGEQAWTAEDWRIAADFTIPDLDAAEMMHRTPDAVWTRRSEIRMGHHDRQVERAQSTAPPKPTLAELFAQLAAVTLQIGDALKERGW